MKLWHRIKNLFLRQKDESGEDMVCSIVLLLRRAHFFSAAEFEAAGERAWGKRFDGQEDPMCFVTQQSWVTLIKAGKSVINVLHADRPYLEDKEAIAQQLPRPEQKKVWLEHTAWMSMDQHNQDLSPVEAYDPLARFALQLADGNVAGVYLPKEQILMPNDGSAEEGLHRILRGELIA